DALHTRLPERRKPPEIGPPDTNSLGTHGQSLDDVRAATEAAVHEHRHAAADRVDDLRQDLDRPAAAVHDTSAMVRNNDPVDPVIGREYCVLVRKDAFEHDLHSYRVAQALN